MLDAVRRWLVLAAALSIVIFTVAWRDWSVDSQDIGVVSVAAEPPPADSDILGMLHQMNVNQINAAKLAQTMSTNDNVRALASQIISDHTTLDQQASALAAQLGIALTNGDSTVVREGSAELDNLRARSGGAAFDLAYTGAQVQDHMEALALIDSLRRVARNPALKRVLASQVRPVIARHLQMAKSIRAGIGH